MVASGRPRYFCAKKSLCSVGRSRSVLRARNISSIPNICQIGEKRGKKRLSHFPHCAEWAAITETASFVLERARQMCSRLHIKYFLRAALFIEKWAFFVFPRAGGAERMDELTLPNAGKGRCDQRDRERARAPNSVSNSYHTATRLCFFGIQERGALHTLSRLLASCSLSLPPPTEW